MTRMNENRLAWLERQDRENPIAIREAGCIHYVNIDHAQRLVGDLALAIIAYNQIQRGEASPPSADPNAGTSAAAAPGLRP